MLAEPQTVTVNAVAKELPRVAFGDRSGVFLLDDGTTTWQLKVSHQLGRRNRRTVRLDATKVAADPLLDGVSREYSMSAYLVIDHPSVGFSATDSEQIVQGLVDWLDVSGNLTTVIGGES